MPSTTLLTSGARVTDWARQLPTREGLRTAAILLTLLLLCGCSAAQQTNPAGTPDAPSTKQTQPKPQAANPMQSSAQMIRLLARKSLVFPDLATNVGPLSAGDKFKLFVNNSVALSTVVAAAAGAGANQALDEPAGYGQGADGYGKRFGSSLARSASSQFFGTFILASALHEDPRFFVRSDLNFGGSVKYAIRRVFVTRSDAGKQEFNWSGLLGPLAGETLANTYFPAGNRGAGNTFSRYGYDLGWSAAGNLLRQYWPAINRRLKLLPEEESKQGQPPHS